MLSLDQGREARRIRFSGTHAAVLAILGLGLGHSASAQEAFPTPPPIAFTAERFEVTGENPLNDEQTRDVLAGFLGPQEGLDGLVAAAEALTRALREAGFPFHQALVPGQTVEGGVIRLEVLAAKLGEVRIRGNEAYDDGNIRRTVPALAEGETPETRRLSRSLALANQHPTRQVTLTFEQSPDAGAVDAVLDVQEQRTWTAFSSFNNIGTARNPAGGGIGRSRLTVGGQYTNFFNLDHIGTASYTFSPEDVEAVQQVSLGYRIPFYRTGTVINLSHIRSDVDTGPVPTVTPGGAPGTFLVSGAGRFTGLLATQSLPSVGAYRQTASIGLDDRLFTSDLQNLALTVGDVRSRPVTIGYQGSFRAPTWTALFSISHSRNIVGGADNDNRAYADSLFVGNADLIAAGTTSALGVPRAGWDAFRASGSASLALPRGFELQGIFEGQYADQALIAGERFGVGGFASVRGFEERAATGDSGVRLTGELYSPRLPYNLRALWFMDSGFTALEEPAAGTVPSQTLVSTGFGLRWNWGNQISLAADYGLALRGTRGSSGGGYKTHITLGLRY
jgi:hemolysin activation/secretion protein